MASSLFTACSSSSTISHSNIRSCAFLPRRHIGQLSFPTTGRARGCSLSIRCSSSSPTSVISCDSKFAKIIDGKAVAKSIRDDIKIEVSRMKESIGLVPGLAVILVGNRKDSECYVKNKKKACEAVGIKPFEVRLAEDSSEEDVLKYVLSFNNDPYVHGILVQLPLPSHMDAKILDAIRMEKDVDGFHPQNLERLSMPGGDPLFVPCTPKGCMELLRRYKIEIKGKNAVVIGRSKIVGRPAAILLKEEGATVTVVHSKTENPEEITRQADIVIVAVGKPNLVRGSWIKPGAVVLDVGITSVEGRLVGDVCYEEVRKVASAITPVPGVVGPMTIAMLLSNTLTSAKRIHNFQ